VNVFYIFAVGALRYTSTSAPPPLPKAKAISDESAVETEGAWKHDVEFD
jgi:hypothetical protein